MSATNRGTERNEQDFYPTPLSAFMPLIPYLPQDKMIWEPAQGDGRLVRAMIASGLPAYGTDLFPQSAADKPVNFLTSSTGTAECIVTNPPFSLAFEFCKHAVNLVPEIYFLMRLNFLASGKRKAWFKEYEPNALFVLSDRPSFCKSVSCSKKCGYKKLEAADAPTPKTCPRCEAKLKVTKSDSCEYAWFYWGVQFSGIYHL